MVKYTVDKSKTYDAILIPTGEERTGENAFPVSREAIRLFKFRGGRFGYIFVTGGYSGFAERGTGPGKTKSEAVETAEYIAERGIPLGRLFFDSHSYETLGNFTYPEIEPIEGNPRLSEFEKILVVGKEGHMWRITDYSEIAFSGLKNEVDYHTIPGRHNDSFMTRKYHQWFMNALKDKKGAEKAHEFLLEEHPFYSTGWYDKPILIRKIEMAARGASWSLR
jgi:hypothetical protein